MFATPENYWPVKSTYLIFAASLVLVVLYYAGYNASSIDRKQHTGHPFSLPTIVAFQRNSENIKENCTPSQPQNYSTHFSWQKLDTDWYLFSAHLDNRTNELLVRIVGLLKGDPNGKLYCRTWPDGALVPVQKRELWIRNWDNAKPGRYYHPYLLSCLTSSATVHGVSIVSDVCQTPTNMLKVEALNQREGKKSFAVCLKPLNFTGDITPRLIEWLELQFLLGADVIQVYVHHLPPQTRKVLEHYDGRVKIVDHTPPDIDQGAEWSNVWQRRRLEVALYNDCFYHHVSTHQYVVNLDLDEAIVPLISDTWIELLNGPAHKHSASVSARNVYFFDSLGVDPTVPPHLHMLSHVYRSANFTPPGFAQKSFFSTLYAEAVAHHYALRALLRSGGTRLMSSLDLGQARLHHYRSQCPSLMERQCEEDFMRYKVRDDALWRFKDPLEEAVASRMQELDFETQQRSQHSVDTD